MRRTGTRRTMSSRAACAAAWLVALALAGCGEGGMATVRARLGDADAQRALAERLLVQGAPAEDVAEGLDWLTRAAEGGSAAAQARLARLYASGELVEKDAAQAQQWLERAAKSGD